MQYNVATVRDVIKALQKFPMDAPVFSYNYDGEEDFPIQVVAAVEPSYPEEYEDMNEEEKEWFNRWFPNGQSPLYCKGDSCIEDYWNQCGVKPVVVLRQRKYNE